MTIAIGLWSLELAPGKGKVVVPPADLKLTNVALGDTLVDPAGRSTIKITYNPLKVNEEDEEEDEETAEEKTAVLCSLTAGKFEHTTIDIVLERDEEYAFTVGGKNIIYLSGNYIDQNALDQPPFDASDMGSDNEGELDELLSDVDMGSHADEMTDASRFEEVDDEEPPVNLKRGRDSDVAAEGAKAEKKNKKLKAENGQAVPASTNKKDDAKQEKKGKKEEKKVEQKSEKKDEKKDKKKEKKDDAEASKNSAPIEKELPGGLKVTDFVVGNGPVAKNGNRVGMRYIGKLQNGKIFDKNVKGKPFYFTLGKGEVIKGWDQGVLGMQVGSERKLTVPPGMAYGKKGTDGIPGNSTLIFEVKLVDLS